jgi:hypothetical protein
MLRDEFAARLQSEWQRQTNDVPTQEIGMTWVWSRLRDVHGLTIGNGHAASIGHIHMTQMMDVKLRPVPWVDLSHCAVEPG